MKGACKFPEHHVSRRGGFGVLVALVLAVVIWRARHVILEVLAWVAVTIGTGGRRRRGGAGGQVRHPPS